MFTDTVGRLTRRADFVLCSKHAWKARKTVVVQLRDRGDDGLPRVGFTASKKVGNAVARNRAKRRLREAAKAVLVPVAKPGHDYVVVARPDTPTASWQRLLDDLEKALLTLHG